MTHIIDKLLKELFNHGVSWERDSTGPDDWWPDKQVVDAKADLLAAIQSVKPEKREYPEFWFDQEAKAVDCFNEALDQYTQAIARLFGGEE